MDSTRPTGWFRIDNDFADSHLPHMTGAAVKVYVALSRRADATTRSCFPSFSQIGIDTGLTRASITSALSELSERSLVQVEKEGGAAGRGGVSNLYVLSRNRTSLKNELVQKVDGSGSKSCAEVVQKLNSNKTKVTRHKNKTRAASAAECDSWFNDFWEAYPRHVAKEAARKAYRAAIDRIAKDDRCTAHEAAHTLLEAAAVYARSVASTEQRFVKHPSTWLNGGCHADEPVEAAPAEPELPFFGGRNDDD